MSALIRAGAWGVGILAFFYVGNFLYELYKQRRLLKNPGSQLLRPSGNFDGNDIRICLMCLDELASEASLALPCKHKFHEKCLQELFQHEECSRVCPSCRGPISEEFIKMKFGS